MNGDPVRPGILAALFILFSITACSSTGSAQPRESAAVSNTPQPGAATRGPSRTRTLSVFAAASLNEALGEIGSQFESRSPGVSVEFNFGGSQQLARQLNEGAPADVFASANQVQMETVVREGRIDPARVEIFVKNRLVVIYPQDNQAGISELQDLAKPGLRLVLAAKEVPAGQYSLDFLDEAASDPSYGETFRERVLDNVVSYEESVKAVLSKVALGEADAGIVYTSDISAGRAEEVGRIEIPEALNVIASYPIAPVEGSSHPDLARAFIDSILSDEGQAILARHGFIPLEP